MTQFDKRTCRPCDHLSEMARRYPQAWAQIDDFRAAQGYDLRRWADWCYIPLAATYAIVSNQRGVDRIFDVDAMRDVGQLAALAAWRMTQGIYRFAPDLYDTLIKALIDNTTTTDLFLRLPQWCCYIETPGMRYFDKRIIGCYAHLEQDQNKGRAELRFLLDADDQLISVPLHIGAWSLAEAVARALRESGKHQYLSGVLIELDDAERVTQLRTAIESIISLIAYICTHPISKNQRTPSNPEPKIINGEWRLMPALSPTTWIME